MKIPSQYGGAGRFKPIKTSVSMNKASKMLGISYPTIRKYINKGWLKAVKRGAGYHIELDEIDRFQREGNHLTPLEKAARDEQEAIRQQKPIDPERIIPGTEPDPVEEADSAFPAYLRNIPKKGYNV